MLQITKLNEEIRLTDEDKSLILLIDYKNHRYNFFRTYEDKTFTSHQVIQLNGLISEAIRMADELLNGKKPEPKPKSDQPQSVKVFAERPCRRCHNPFIPSDAYQKLCDQCREGKE